MVRSNTLDRTRGASNDTICQLATGLGHAGTAVGVAILRLSGTHANHALRCLTRKSTTPAARTMTLCSIYHPVSGEMLDSGCLCVSFPSPNSFTGEDVCELHVHGNAVVVKEALEAFTRVPLTEEEQQLGVMRLADAGEFTRRAFLNGKLDLTQVEGLADLLNAETEKQRSQALRQMKGELGALYNGWRSALVGCLAHCEAVIDFAEDEADVGEVEILANVLPRVTKLCIDMENHLSDGRRGEILRNGVVVAIGGKPNVGKSTLLNQLAGREAAIVSAIPGTTRDVVEVSLNLGGYPVLLADTAGLRESNDVIEQEGVRRAKTRILSSDLKMLLFDSESFLPLLQQQANQSMALLQNDNLDLLPLVDENTIVVISKADLIGQGGAKIDADYLQRLVGAFFESAHNSPADVVVISCEKGIGVSRLVEVLGQQVQRRMQSGGGGGGSAVITRQRHRDHLTECLENLRSFHEWNQRGDLVLAAEALRQATRELGKIVGEVDVEEILDVMFRDFCIGK